MSNLIPVHRHCKVCGKSIPEDSITCSTACATKREAALRSRKMNTYLFYIGGFIVLVLVLFAIYHV